MRLGFTSYYEIGHRRPPKSFADFQIMPSQIPIRPQLLLFDNVSTGTRYAALFPMFRLFHPLIQRARGFLGVLALRPLQAEPFINEFMAANSSALVGDVGDPSDWIEISNPDPTPSHSHFYHITTPAAP